jgi:hypothetical protein
MVVLPKAAEDQQLAFGRKPFDRLLQTPEEKGGKYD